MERIGGRALSKLASPKLLVSASGLCKTFESRSRDTAQHASIQSGPLAGCRRARPAVRWSRSGRGTHSAAQRGHFARRQAFVFTTALPILHADGASRGHLCRSHTPAKRGAVVTQTRLCESTNLFRPQAGRVAAGEPVYVSAEPFCSRSARPRVSYGCRGTLVGARDGV